MLGAVQATSHYLNQWWLYYRRICESLGLNELNLVDHVRMWFEYSKLKYADVWELSVVMIIGLATWRNMTCRGKYLTNLCCLFVYSSIKSVLYALRHVTVYLDRYMFRKSNLNLLYPMSSILYKPFNSGSHYDPLLSFINPQPKNSLEFLWQICLALLDTIIRSARQRWIATSNSYYEVCQWN